MCQNFTYHLAHVSPTIQILSRVSHEAIRKAFSFIKLRKFCNKNLRDIMKPSDGTNPYMFSRWGSI